MRLFSGRGSPVSLNVQGQVRHTFSPSVQARTPSSMHTPEKVYWLT